LKPLLGEEMRARVLARAQQLGLSITQLMRRAGISREVWNKKLQGGHRLDTLVKLAQACEWTLPELFGAPPPQQISIELSAKAFATAERLLPHMAPRNRTRERLIEAHAYIYDVLVERERGGLSTDQAVLDSLLQLLIRMWAGAAEDAAR
jgi:transcriptional regulator with XRE-family HTH domain